MGCSKEDIPSNDLNLDVKNSVAAKAELSKKPGAMQISGIGVYADVSECDYEAMGATYAIQFTGDLEGCFYVFADEYDCSPSGTYREKGREYFVGLLMERQVHFGPSTDLKVNLKVAQKMEAI